MSDPSSVNLPPEPLPASVGQRLYSRAVTIAGVGEVEIECVAWVDPADGEPLATTTVSGARVPRVDVAASALPTGAATNAKLDDVRTDLADLEAKVDSVLARLAVATGDPASDAQGLVARLVGSAIAQAVQLQASAPSQAASVKITTDGSTIGGTLANPFYVEPVGTRWQNVQNDESHAHWIRAAVTNPAYLRLSDGTAAIDPARRAQLPEALVGGRLSVAVGASALPTDAATQTTLEAARVILAAIRDSDGIKRIVDTITQRPQGATTGTVTDLAVTTSPQTAFTANADRLGLTLHFVAPVGVEARVRLGAAGAGTRSLTLEDGDVVPIDPPFHTLAGTVTGSLAGGTLYVTEAT